MIILNRSANVSTYQTATAIPNHEPSPHPTPTYPTTSSSSRRTHEEDIYEDLCYVTLRIGKELCGKTPTVTGLGSYLPEKRDYCIRELLETEKNYVDALNMIIRHFSRPLLNVLDSSDHHIIFNHIDELAEIHSGFHRELLLCVSVNGFNGFKISTCFFNWKYKFVIYGDYCANLPKAQNSVDELCSKNESIAISIARCQHQANDGKFKLRDLLSLPMQRILKYHLLLKELLKNTFESHDDYSGLQKAYQAMIDIGDYINEVKRDSETLQVIQGIQHSIIDLEMPENTELKDYGRLVNDGELKMKLDDEKSLKSRYIFVFDKVVLICKSLRNGQHTFKAALILSDFQVEECPAATTTAKPFKEKWNHQWMLVHTQTKQTYTFCVKSEEQKRKWIDAVEKALDNVNPEPCRNSLVDHAFIMSSFKSPQICNNCRKLLGGLFFQGYRCTICDIAVHKSCILSAQRCGAPSLPPRSPSCNYVNLSLSEYPWFAGTMDRTIAQSVLEKCVDSTFLVRISPNQKGVFAISLNCNGTVKHMRICKSDGLFYLSESKFFNTVVELVKWYEEQTLAESFAGLNCTLGIPYKEALER